LAVEIESRKENRHRGAECGGNEICAVFLFYFCKLGSITHRFMIFIWQIIEESGVSFLL